MTNTLRARLDIIDEWLMDPDHGAALADVMSALRGPDSDSSTLKYAYTVPIRRVAFPKLTASATGEVPIPSLHSGRSIWNLRGSSTFSQEQLQASWGLSDMFNRDSKIHSHYLTHIRAAAVHLGILK